MKSPSMNRTTPVVSPTASTPSQCHTSPPPHPMKDLAVAFISTSNEALVIVKSDILWGIVITFSH